MNGATPAFSAMLDILRTTRGNIASLGPSGQLDQVWPSYRNWLEGVGRAIDLAEEELSPDQVCRNCVAWRHADKFGYPGQCWSPDRLDGDLTKGPAGYCYPDRTCEAWRAK